jgi:hypothetical protein
MARYEIGMTPAELSRQVGEQLLCELTELVNPCLPDCVDFNVSAAGPAAGRLR